MSPELQTRSSRRSRFPLLIPKRKTGKSGMRAARTRPRSCGSSREWIISRALMCWPHLSGAARPARAARPRGSDQLRVFCMAVLISGDSIPADPRTNPAAEAAKLSPPLP